MGRIENKILTGIPKQSEHVCINQRFEPSKKGFHEQKSVPDNIRDKVHLFAFIDIFGGNLFGKKWVFKIYFISLFSIPILIISSMF